MTTRLTLALLFALSLAACRTAKPHSVELSWTPPAQPPSYYQVYRSTQPGMFDPNTPYAARVEGSHFADTDVKAGTTYYYRVVSVLETNQGIQKSTYSDEISAIVPKD